MVIIALKLLLVTLFCALYALGGQGHKQFRRFVLPSVYTALCSLILYLHGVVQIVPYLALPLMFLASNPPVSYGVKYTHDKLPLKILFRGLCGLFYGLATSLPIYLLTEYIQLSVLNCALSTVASIGLGAFNPLPDKWGNWATIMEDVLISLCYVGVVALTL